jgi:hypothetical protein
MSQPLTIASSSPLVGLTVAIERHIICCDNTMIIGAGTAMHAASLRCAKCGRHRGWMPAAAVPFLEQTVAHFGRRTEPIILRAEHMAMATKAEFDNPDSGALFRNDKKEKGDKRPDYKGTLDVQGTEYWLSAWIKTSKAGEKYMSVAVRQKDSEAREARRSKARDDDLDREIDFP